MVDGRRYMEYGEEPRQPSIILPLISSTVYRAPILPIIPSTAYRLPIINLSQPCRELGGGFARLNVDGIENRYPGSSTLRTARCRRPDFVQTLQPERHNRQV